MSRKNSTHFRNKCLFCYNQNMKRVLLAIIFLLCNCFALTMQNDILDSLKLSQKQKNRIENVKIKYNQKRVEFNSQILLKNMQLAQYRGLRNEQTYIKAINYEIKELNNELSEIDKNREKEIISCLNFFQKIKYKKLKNSN